jgi:hypothetical protein
VSTSLTYAPALPWQARATDGAYGRCLGGVEDMTPGMVSGRLALAQALMREAITPTGTNVVDPAYGYDVTQHLNGRTKAADLSECATMLTGRWLVDDRVKDAQVSVSLTLNVLVISALIFDKDGPFPLTFSASDAGTALLAKVE